MTFATIRHNIFEKGSYLCVGLDTDINKLPNFLQRRKDSIIEFNKQIINATLPHCVAYKINTAFYESMGSKGWDIMEETLSLIPDTHFKIADAKRGDIGNTSSHYAKAFFETLNFDAITVAPYMGEDSIKPFLEYENKWTIVLGLTSNKGSIDFQQQELHGRPLYEHVIEKISTWGTKENLMFVTGATKAEEIKRIREIVPDNFLLVPGIGFQGGNLNEVSNNGLNNDCGLLVNVSRAIIYASEKEDFASEAKAIAIQYQTEMKELLAVKLNKKENEN